MPNMPRIADICKELNLSKATVSKALNGYTTVREETRNQVLACARRLGYSQPQGRDMNTQLIRVGITASATVETPNSISPFQALLNKMVTGLDQYHYDTIVIPPLLLQEQSVPYEQAVENLNLDCAFLTGLRMDDPYALQLRTTKFPTVMWDFSVANPNVHNVCCDSAEGMRLATAHLTALGHRRIGMINGHSQAQVSLQRRDGYILALADAGIPYDPALVYEGDFSETSGVIGLQYLLPRQVTAIVCVSDVTAMGVFRAAHAQNLKIPEDLSVVGYDNTNLTEYVSPGLTSVEQHLDQVGMVIVTTIHSMMQHRPVSDSVIRPSLVVRGSTAVPGRTE